MAATLFPCVVSVLLFQHAYQDITQIACCNIFSLHRSKSSNFSRLQDAESFLIFTNAAPLRSSKLFIIFTTDRSIILQKFKHYSLLPGTKQDLCLCPQRTWPKLRSILGPGSLRKQTSIKYTLLCHTSVEGKLTIMVFCHSCSASTLLLRKENFFCLL